MYSADLPQVYGPYWWKMVTAIKYLASVPMSEPITWQPADNPDLRPWKADQQMKPFETIEQLAEPHKLLDRIVPSGHWICHAIGMPGTKNTSQSIPSRILPMLILLPIYSSVIGHVASVHVELKCVVKCVRF
jgi:hypothetical protein